MTRNYIVFAILSALLLISWLVLQQKFGRPPQDPQKKNEEQAEERKPPRTAEQAKLAFGAELVAGQGGAIAAGPWSLAVYLDQVKNYIPPPTRWWQIAEPWRPALHLLPTTPLQALALLPRVVTVKAPVPESTTLGGDGYHLAAVLTTRGAAIRSLTLTRFKAANYLGRPTDHALELIPDDPIQPSYQIHHYPDPKAEAPVLGLGDMLWKLEKVETPEGGTHKAVYSAVVPGMPVKLLRTWSLAPRDYHLTHLLEIEDLREKGTSGALAFRYQMAGAHGLPIEGEWYVTTARTAVTITVNANKARFRVADDATQVSYKQGAQRVPPAAHGTTEVQSAGVLNQFFAAMVVVDDQQPEGGLSGDVLAWARATLETSEKKVIFDAIRGELLDFKEIDTKSKTLAFRSYRLLPRAKKHLEEELQLAEGDEAVLSFYEMNNDHIVTWVRRGHVEKPQFDDLTNRVTSEVIELRAGKKVAHQFVMYHGPAKVAQLYNFTGDEAVPKEVVDRYIEKLNLDLLTDYASNSFSATIHFSDLVLFFTKLMHWLLGWLHFFVRSYGLSIILLTVIVRGAMFPISRKQALFSVKMQELAPELKKLGEKYKNDPQGKTQATMDLYRKHNIHPLGSCLPMLMQLPVFLGLYFCLQESILFRLAPFLWIDNLAAPDMLLWWSERIPVISDPVDPNGGFINMILSFFYLGPYLNVLPVFAVALMIIQQQLLMPPPTDEQQELNQKTMKYVSLLFGVMFYKVASGLCLYFIATSLWGLAERRMLPKKKPALAVAGPSGPPGKAKPAPTGPRGRGRGPGKKDEETALDKVKAWWHDVLEQAKKK